MPLLAPTSISSSLGRRSRHACWMRVEYSSWSEMKPVTIVLKSVSFSAWKRPISASTRAATASYSALARFAASSASVTSRPSVAAFSSFPPFARSFSRRSFFESIVDCVRLCARSAVSRAVIAALTAPRMRTYSFIGSSKVLVSRSASSVYVAERRPTQSPMEEMPLASDSLIDFSHSASWVSARPKPVMDAPRARCLSM
mmetsp:Transcript_29365/g.75737  ORF Transcript_29365/g.75737 Transcript_29365/m.75737 type:complete len:200 (-) Transcript_29365:962-1561(-)